MFILNFCQWLDSNLGPLVSEATAESNEPQPLPKSLFLALKAILLLKMITSPGFDLRSWILRRLKLRPLQQSLFSKKLFALGNK